MQSAGIFDALRFRTFSLTITLLYHAAEPVSYNLRLDLQPDSARGGIQVIKKNDTYKYFRLRRPHS